jgi:hypothetical protein
MKIFAGRPIDWRDVEMVLRRYGPAELDLDAVRLRVAPLVAAKEDAEAMLEFERLIRRAKG